MATSGNRVSGSAVPTAANTDPTAPSESPNPSPIHSTPLVNSSAPARITASERTRTSHSMWSPILPARCAAGSVPPTTSRRPDPASLGDVDPHAFLAALTADPEVAASLVSVRELSSRSPEPLAFPTDLPDLLVQRAELLGITGLYAHQVRSLEALRRDENLIMATGTASGKTFVYNAAFAEAALTIPKATALYLYPTKALARDQLRAVRALKIPQLKASVYDGDTPQSERPLIRKNANLVMTNPDMLHLSLLPDHARWADFFFRLSLIVVDEAHICRGVFGSHVSMVLRRLRRLVAHYGGTPRWCLASATIGNPGELATRLTGLDFDAVTEDDSPRGEKLFALWNPPIVDEETGQRRSALTESAGLVARLVEQDVRTIGFARSRRAAELLAEFARREVGDAQKRAKIKAYRAGYLAEDRRKIERELADGELLAVASTNALELGHRHRLARCRRAHRLPGNARVALAAGRARGPPGHRRARGTGGPGRPARPVPRPPSGGSLRQAGGGRGHRPHQPVRVGAAPAVRRPGGRRCARTNSPSSASPRVVGDAVARMVDRGELGRRRDAWHDRGKEPPHRAVDIRAGGGHVYRIIIEDTGEMLGTADEGRAFKTLHPGAVYLHMGEQYLVRELTWWTGSRSSPRPTPTTTPRPGTSPISAWWRSGNGVAPATSTRSSGRCG